MESPRLVVGICSSDSIRGGGKQIAPLRWFENRPFQERADTSLPKSLDSLEMALSESMMLPSTVMLEDVGLPTVRNHTQLHNRTEGRTSEQQTWGTLRSRACDQLRIKPRDLDPSPLDVEWGGLVLGGWSAVAPWTSLGRAPESELAL